MTFLARLIERHLWDVPAPFPILEPRLPSRFELVALAGAPWAVERDVEAPRDPEPRVSAAPRSAWEAPRFAERGEPPAGAVPRVGAAPTALRTVSAIVHAAATLGAPADRRALSPVIEAPPAAPTRASTAAARPDSAPAVGTPIEGPAARPPAPARPGLRPPPLSSRTVRGARNRPEPRGEPTIHVTIGRVDVRAVMTPVGAPPRPPAPVETASLEEYLRGRAGGRR
jgi:hypothetical protein